MSTLTIGATVGPDLEAVTWQLDEFAGLWMSTAELAAVTDWMRDNGLVRATWQHPVVVEQGAVTFGQDLSGPTVRAADREIDTVTVALCSLPPQVRYPVVDPAARDALYAVLAQHEWCRPGFCADCTPLDQRADGRPGFRYSTAVDWPCPAAAVALQTAGLPLPPLPGVASDVPGPTEPVGVSAQRGVIELGESVEPYAARAFAAGIRRAAETTTALIEARAAELRDRGGYDDRAIALWGMADATYGLELAATRAEQQFARHCRLADQIHADPALAAAAADTYLGRTG